MLLRPAAKTRAETSGDPDALGLEGAASGGLEDGYAARRNIERELVGSVQRSDLNDLETQAIAANQNLQAATQRVLEARAQALATRSNLYPSVSGGFSPSRARNSGTKVIGPGNAETSEYAQWDLHRGPSGERGFAFVLLASHRA